LPRRLLLHAPGKSAAAGGPGTGSQVLGLVSLMRVESATENLGGLAMLNALSTALFAVALRLASEVTAPPDGLLALAANPRVRSASDLLTDIRMTVAANALKTSNMSTGRRRACRIPIGRRLPARV